MVMQRYLKMLCAGLLAITSLTVVADKLQGSASNTASPKKLYVRAGVGFPTYRKVDSYENRTKAKFKPVFNAAAGWNCGKYLSAEIEGGYASFPIRTSSFSDEYKATSESLTVLLNLVAHKDYVFRDNIIRPFAGVGAGYVNNKLGDMVDAVGDVRLTGSRVGKLGYQLFLGVEWMMRPNLSLVLDARWIDFNTLKWVALRSGPGREFHLKTQTLNIGVKFNF